MYIEWASLSTEAGDRRSLDGYHLPMATIDQILVGSVESFGPGDRMSAIRKKPVSGRVAIGRLGIEGDHHGDTIHHGGVEAAVHHYSFDNYALWRGELPDHAGHFSAPGFFGENLSSIGLDETNVCIGDIYRFGSTLLQVSQGRQPCWKLARRSTIPDFALKVQATGRTGWFYRVVEPGSAEGGDDFWLVERPRPEWTLIRVLRIMYVNPLDSNELEGMASLPELSPSWRRLAQTRLDSGTVEGWTSRVTLPTS